MPPRLHSRSAIDDLGHSSSSPFLHHERTRHLRVIRTMDRRHAQGVHDERLLPARSKRPSRHELRERRRVSYNIVLESVEVAPSHPLAFVDYNRFVAERVVALSTGAGKDVDVSNRRVSWRWLRACLRTLATRWIQQAKGEKHRRRHRAKSIH